MRPVPWKRVSTSIGMALLGVMLVHGHASVQPADPTRVGTIIPVVVPGAEPDQTYALYLPSSYSIRKKWPAIYAFDPAARRNKKEPL
jgi:hypothetical protein